MWVEFVVGSRSHSEGFSPGSPVPTFSKTKILNSNSIGNSRATGLSVEDCCVSPSLSKVDLFVYYNLDRPSWLQKITFKQVKVYQ